MATTVDELIVEIKADLKNVTAGLNNVKKQINSTEKSSRRLAGSFKRLPQLIAAYASFQTVKNVAMIGDSFEQLRISLGTLYGGQADAALNRINEFAQTTPFQLEDVTKAFITLKAQGIEPNIDLMTAFGDAASATLTPLDSFNSLVRMLGRSTQGALGLEDLNQLADRGIPVFQMLEDRIGKTRLELTEFGSTAEGANKIMEALGEGLQENFGGLMSQQMDTLGVKVSNMQIAFKQLAAALYESGINTYLKNTVDFITSMVNKFRQFLDELFNGPPVPESIVTLAGSGMYDRAREEIEKVVNDAREQIAELEAISSANARGQGRSVNANLIRAERQIAELRAFIANVREFEADFPDPMQIAIPEGNKTLSLEQIDALTAIRKALEDTITPAEELDKLFEQLRVVEAGQEGQEGALGGLTPEEIQRVKDHLNELRDELEATAGTFKEVMAPIIAEAVQQFTGDFVNALMAGQSALSAFNDFAKNLVGQIITTFLQLTIVNRILNAIFGNFSGFTPLPTISIGGKAGGGNISRGQPYLVGERGPELFMPNTGGTIRNGADTRRMMGGDGGIVVNQTINLSAGVVGTVRSEVERMMPRIADITKLGVLEATRRGGSYRKGLLSQ